MHTDDPIVVTGLGVMTPLGDSSDGVADALRQGRCAAAPLPEHDYSTMPSSWGGSIVPGVLEPYELCPIKFKMFKPYLKYGVVAVRNALTDAGLMAGGRMSDRYPELERGVFVCQGTNGDNAEGLFDAFAESTGPDGEFDLRRFASSGLDAVHPKWMLPSISNNLIFFLTAEYGLRGDNNNVTYAPEGGAYMLDAAVASLRMGACAMAVVAGADSILNWQAQDDLAKSGILGRGRRMAPFTDRADGALPSEGAAALVLELESAALERGAPVYGRLRSTWQHCSARHLLEPAEDGSETAVVLGRLLQDVPEPNEAVMVCCNGMAVPSFDRAELEGLANVMAAEPDRELVCTSAKHLFCHTYSASFVVDVVASLLALRNEFVMALPEPPTTKVTAAARFVTEPVDRPLRYGIVLTQGLGGNTGGVLLERP